MNWQDLVIFLANLVFIAALVPMVRNGTIVPFTSAFPTAVALLAVCFCYVTVGLVISAFISMVAASLWGVLALRGYLHSKEKPANV